MECGVWDVAASTVKIRTAKECSCVFKRDVTQTRGLCEAVVAFGVAPVYIDVAALY